MIPSFFDYNMSMFVGCEFRLAGFQHTYVLTN